jgi:hypothetical protein
VLFDVWSTVAGDLRISVSGGIILAGRSHPYGQRHSLRVAREVTMHRKCGTGSGGYPLTMAAAAMVSTVLAASWCAARPALAAPPRRVVHAAQADLGDVARQLPLRGSLRVEGVPFAGSTTALELERFEAFAPDAQIVIAGPHGDVVRPAPDNAYYRGAVEGDLGAVAVLTARATGGVRGLIVKNGEPWIISDEPGPQRSPGLRTRKVDFAHDFPGRKFHCGAEEVPQPAAALDTPVGTAGSAEPAAATTLVNYTARVAVETDYEFFKLFGNTADAADYVGDLFAYASTIYESEINTSLVVSYLKLWTTNDDPWVQTACSSVLSEFRSYWMANNGAINRTTAHMLSGRYTGCGIAYVGALCTNTYGYGVTGSLTGAFNILNPGVVWDILAVSHEIGHNFNSPHTHCYNGIGGSTQPVDQCYSGETNCYSGLTSLPCALGSGHGCGTIMSYCHTLTGGYSNITLTFGTGFPYGVLPNRVPSRMHDYVVSMAASYPSCLQYTTGPNATPIIAATPTPGSPTVTATRTATLTATAVATATRTATLAPTLTPIPTDSATPLPTSTATLAPPTPTNSAVPTSTGAATPVSTSTRTATVPPTLTATATATAGAACPQTDLGNSVPLSYTGSTIGAQNLMGGASCGAGGGAAPDASFLFTAPVTAAYQIDTLGSAFDTILYVRNATCAGAQLACNDDANGSLQSLVTVPLSAGQSVVIVVDGYSTLSGAFTLNVRLAPAATPTATGTATPAATMTYTVTLGPTLTPVPTNTALPTLTPSATNSATPPPTPTRTNSPVATATATAVPTRSVTPVPPVQLAAVQDAWIDQANPTQNKGNDGNLHVSPVAARIRRTLVKFDLSSMPSPACVSSAALRLTLTAVQSPAQTFAVHRLTQSWTEGKGTSNSGVTWSRRDGVTAWTTGGGDFVATPTASVSTGTTKNVTLQWDVTADVKTFVAGTASNQGWLVKDSNEGTGKEFQFASRETATTSSRPQLQITFAPCP